MLHLRRTGLAERGTDMQILHNIECRFIIYCRGNTVTTVAGTLSLIITVPKVPFFPVSTIDNDNLFLK